MAEIVVLDTDDYVFSTEERSLMAALVADIEPIVRDRLPMLPTRLNLTLYPGRRVVPETGHTGSTPTKDWIQMTVDPSDPRGIGAILKAQVASCFAHEAHHAARYVAAGRNALDGRVVSTAVFEGLATVFETEITGNTPPWGEYDDGAVVDQWLDELIALPQGTDGRPWRFRHPDGRRWIAYRAGTRAIQRAKAATAQTAADLVGASTDEVLDAAGVKPIR